jgi:hypothetical protein
MRLWSDTKMKKWGGWSNLPRQHVMGCRRVTFIAPAVCLVKIKCQSVPTIQVNTVLVPISLYGAQSVEVAHETQAIGLMTVCIDPNTIM